MLNRVLATVLVLAAAPGLLLAQERGEERAPSDPLGLLGVVVDRESREPLRGVSVTLRPQDDSGGTGGLAGVAVTDARGRFGFSGLDDGRYRIEIGRIGYGSVSDTVFYRSALGLRVEAELVPEAVELEPLLVLTEARSRHLEGMGFYRRQGRGVGRFITRDDIEERDPLRVTDLLTVMPGVQLRRGKGVVGSETVALMRGGCVADVYLDGVRTIPPFPLDAALLPDDLAAMEVYQASELPAEYGTSPCGALVIWTRLPEPDERGRPWSWLRALGAAGFLVAGFLLTHF